MKLLLLVMLLLITPASVSAHGGRLDKNSGHNCNVASCANSYHYHYGGDTTVEHTSPKSTSNPTPSTPKSSPAPSTSSTSTSTKTQSAPKPVVTTKDLSETEEVAFTTEYRDDDTLELGEESVVQEGVAGVKTLLYKLTLKDNVETSRELVSETITTEPLPKIIARGTKVAAPIEEVAQEVAAVEEEIPPAGPVETVVTLGIMGGLSFLAYKKIAKSAMVGVLKSSLATFKGKL